MRRPTTADATRSPWARALLTALAAAILSGAPGCAGRSILSPEDGGQPGPDGGQAGPDGGPDGGPVVSDGGAACGGGIACQLDADCLPPLLVCGADSCCARGCSGTGCPAGQSCAATGHCVPTPPADGGPPPSDGGAPPDAGPPADGGSGDGGGAVGVPTPTLCHTCQSSAGCMGGGLCFTDSVDGLRFCSQSCDTLPCPDGYACSAITTTLHQCLPQPGACPNPRPPPSDGGTGDGGPADGGPHDGGVSDAGSSDAGSGLADSSGNPNGCGQCQPCSAIEDCRSGSTCIQGRCFAFCFGRGILGQLFCQNTAGPPSSCHGYPQDTSGSFDPGYCITEGFDCTPLDGGAPFACAPAGVNPQCAPETIPAAGFANQPLLGGQPAGSAGLVRTSSARLVGALEVRLAGGGSEIHVLASDDNGGHWFDRGAVLHPHRNPREPRLAVSRSTTGTPQEAVHLAFTVDATFASGDGGTVEGTGIDYTRWAAASSSAPGAASLVTGEVTDAQHPGLAGAAGVAGTLGEVMLTYSTGGGVRVTTANLFQGFRSPSSLTTTAGGVATPAYRYPVDGMALVAVATGTSVAVYGTDDSGATWSAAVQVGGSLFPSGDAPAVVADGNDHAWVGFTAAGPNSGGTAGDGFWAPQVVSLSVKDRTPTWLQRVRVAGDAAGCWQHLRLALALDGSNLLAAFVDDRAAGHGQLWLTRSTDLGVTFGAERRVSAQEFVFDWGSFAPPRQLGAVGLCGNGGNAFLLWSDPRDGVASRPFSAAGPW